MDGGKAIFLAVRKDVDSTTFGISLMTYCQVLLRDSSAVLLQQVSHSRVNIGEMWCLPTVDKRHERDASLRVLQLYFSLQHHAKYTQGVQINLGHKVQVTCGDQLNCTYNTF